MCFLTAREKETRTETGSRVGSLLWWTSQCCFEDCGRILELWARRAQNIMNLSGSLEDKTAQLSADGGLACDVSEGSLRVLQDSRKGVLVASDQLKNWL